MGDKCYGVCARTLMCTLASEAQCALPLPVPFLSFHPEEGTWGEAATLWRLLGKVTLELSFQTLSDCVDGK